MPLLRPDVYLSLQLKKWDTFLGYLDNVLLTAITTNEVDEEHKLALLPLEAAFDKNFKILLESLAHDSRKSIVQAEYALVKQAISTLEEQAPSMGRRLGDLMIKLRLYQKKRHLIPSVRLRKTKESEEARPN